MSIMLNIFDVSIKRVYGSLCFSLCFELLPQQMCQSKKKYIDVCAHKYKQVVLETLF